MHLIQLVEASGRIAGTSSRNEKERLVAECLERASLGEVPLVVSYLSGELPQGRIGVGPAALQEAFPGTAAPEPSLELADVDEAFTRIGSLSGPGSGAGRIALLGDLLERATRDEQNFLARLLFGELRQGAQEGVMLAAIAAASGVGMRRVHRAHMLTGDPARVASLALGEGAEGLSGLGVELFRPLKPMLAQSAESVTEAMAGLDAAVLDRKLDGTRVQVHRRGEEVRVYSRSLRDVTASVPEVVEAVLAMDGDELVLDGEAIALDEGGRPLPFQTTMSRFGRSLNVAEARGGTPLTPFFFDCLQANGRALLERPLIERLGHLDAVVPERWRVPRLQTADAGEGEGFLADMLEGGHEGVMVKAPASPYEAGRRGSAWIKVKQAHTLDLVVLAAEWGHGRREGWLSNLHLGARDPEKGDWVMLGKTFKGMTDEVLAWQTEKLLELEVGRSRNTVRVRPELVAEIAFNDIQASPRYPGGVALRFARLKGYRPDKSPREADTIETVRAIHEGGT